MLSITVCMQLNLFEVVLDTARLFALAAEFSPYVLLTDLVEYEVPPLADDDSELTTLQHNQSHNVPADTTQCMN